MIIITGPTSSGKTSLAIKLAKQFGAELISADSRQIYKYMDVGTGKKPIDLVQSSFTPHKNYWVIEGVKVHMYDVANPDEEYSSFQYATDAREIIKNIKLPIIAGGTGFYIDSLVSDNIDFKITSDNKIRDKLSNKSLEELAKMIPEDYLNTWNNSERNNPARLIRAIQIYQQTGEWPDKSRKQFDASENNLVIELTASREFLYKRVDAWAENIWTQLLAEVVNITSLGYENSEPMNGIIYKTAKDALNGIYTPEKAIELMKFDLHNYIRKQQTWFKKYKNSIKVDITEKSFDTAVFSRVQSYIDEQR